MINKIDILQYARLTRIVAFSRLKHVLLQLQQQLVRILLALFQLLRVFRFVVVVVDYDFGLQIVIVREVQF